MNDSLRNILIVISNKEGSSAAIATYLLNGNIPNNIKDVCDACSVTAPAVTRFAKELGLGGFKELKYLLTHQKEYSGISGLLIPDIKHLEKIFQSDNYINLTNFLANVDIIYMYGDKKGKPYTNVLEYKLNSLGYIIIQMSDISTLERLAKSHDKAGFIVISSTGNYLPESTLALKNVYHLTNMPTNRPNNVYLLEHNTNIEFRLTLASLLMDYLSISIQNIQSEVKHGNQENI